MTFSYAGQKSQFELTPKEMLDISQEISRNFAPNATFPAPDDNDFHVDPGTFYRFGDTVDKKADSALHSSRDSHIGLAAKELYGISQEISRQFMPDVSTTLPELFLLPVDPYHLYAYWDLGDKKKSLTPQQASGQNLTLRIYWRPDENTGITRSNVWFDITVHDPEARQQVPLPIDDTAYSAALGKLDPDQTFDIYAVSNIVRVPPAKMRMAASRRPDDSDLPMANTKAARPTLDHPAHASTDLLDQETLIRSELTDILYEKRNDTQPSSDKRWFVKLHFNRASAHRYGDAKIDSKLMNHLNEKGIDIQLLMEPVFLEASQFQNKNASGQGI